MQYIGIKADRVFITNAASPDDAYLNIGEKLDGFRCDDAGNVDLDEMRAIPELKLGETIEVTS